MFNGRVETGSGSGEVSLSEKLFDEEQRYISPGMQQVSLLSRMVMKEARGRYITDVNGKKYLDFMAGVAVCSLGHCHPKYVKALYDQLQKVTVGSFTTENRVALVKLISSLAPGDLRRTQFFSGGAEAVEAALRLAKAYTKKQEVIAFWGGFHGKTGGVLGLIGDPFKKNWEIPHPGLHLVPYADCYRCPFKKIYPGCDMFCLDFLRRYIENCTVGSIAAILVETMQGTAGNIVPPPEFLPGLKKIAEENDCLLIADEMITGFGRTGLFWGSDHTNTVPDILTIGKGMGSGFPVSGLISTDEITEARPYSKPSASSSSYGGNPLGATAALTTIKLIQEENLVENAREVGNYIMNGLKEMQEKYDFIGIVRGIGLMIGVELVKDRETKEPLSKKIAQEIFLKTVDKGMIAMNYKPQFRINPPLNITKEEAAKGLEILDDVFKYVAEKLPYKE